MRRLLRAIANDQPITQDVSTLENPAIVDQLRGVDTPVARTAARRKPKPSAAPRMVRPVVKRARERKAGRKIAKPAKRVAAKRLVKRKAKARRTATAQRTPAQGSRGPTRRGPTRRR